MSFIYKRTCSIPYKGNVKAVILDWSGTVSDAGVLAPVVAFIETFKKYGISITMEEARKPMGLRKDLHINEILKISRIRNEWKSKYGIYPTIDHSKNMFKDFTSIQLDCLKDYAEIIKGADTITNYLKNKNIKIGSTTGFTRVMVDILLKEATCQGVHLDTTVAGDEVINGARPGPFMLYKNLDNLGIFPIQSVIKVDDTISGIGEGINAGCWTVGVSRWSNYTNYDSLKQLKNASSIDMANREYRASQKLLEAKPHYIIPDINELPAVIDDINTRMSLGGQP